MHEDSFGTKTARARINTCLHTCGWVYTKEKVVEAGEAEGGGGGGSAWTNIACPYMHIWAGGWGERAWVPASPRNGIAETHTA